MPGFGGLVFPFDVPLATLGADIRFEVQCSRRTDYPQQLSVVASSPIAGVSLISKKIIGGRNWGEYLAVQQRISRRLARLKSRGWSEKLFQGRETVGSTDR